MLPRHRGFLQLNSTWTQCKTPMAMVNGKKCNCKGNRSAPTAWMIILTYRNRIILDASARRFQAHKIYLRIAAARRWSMNRAQVLQGQKPAQRHHAALANADRTLHNVGRPFTFLFPFQLPLTPSFPFIGTCLTYR